MEVEKLSKSFGFSLPAHQNQGQFPFRNVSEELSTLPSGEYFVSWYKGSKRQMDPVGSNPEAALAALEKKRLLPAYIAVGGEIKWLNFGPKRDRDCPRLHADTLSVICG